MSSSNSLVSIPQWKVEVWLYDLSMGMARALSPQFLGKQIDGIWHTGVVVYGFEYFYGGGIQALRPGTTMAGQPMRKIEMGYTSIPQSTFHTFLRGVSSRFTPATYSLLSHNCNNFTHEAVKYLTGREMPAYITGLPEEALSTPMGMMLRPMIQQMEQQFREGGAGMVPWTEDLISLPSIRNVQPDRYHTPLPEETKQIETAAHLIERKEISGAATSISGPVPAGEAGSHPAHHPHANLHLAHITASSKPLIATDKKLSSFYLLIKNYSKKESASLPEEERIVIENVVNKLSGEKGLTADEEKQVATIFDRIIHSWPKELMFPVFSLLRILVLRPNIAAYFENKGEEFMKYLSTFIPTNSSSSVIPSPAQTMSLCLTAQFFSKPSFASTLARSSILLDTARSALDSSHQTVRLMAATVLYNISLVQPKDDSDEVIELISALVIHSQSEENNEVTQRLLLALGHLIYGNSSGVLLLPSLEWNGASIKEKFKSNKEIAGLVDDILKMIDHEQKNF